ncbi:Protein phosphatase 2A regulatory B subunit (B56 family) family protein [Cryptosporidium meleagridis]|uniref:Protein phosphatase 2A regulatory B subunit (B56 family) family protein n=1 Tax=Cryptosporidium meleagridis TaxID=93969 RepID=A0A2P4Z0M2_9CRYT|nr:Protein phosphatase 2A regulatory B subunit (B56 family) family protein [Cryptosporidium meleagridis]
MNRVFQSLRRRVSSSEAGNTQNSTDCSTDNCTNSQVTKNKSDSKNAKNISKSSNSSNISLKPSTDSNSVNDDPNLSNKNEIQGTVSSGPDSPLNNDNSLSSLNTFLNVDLSNNINPKQISNDKYNNSFQSIQINKSDSIDGDNNISFPPIEFIKNEKFAFLQAYSLDYEDGTNRSSDEDFNDKQSNHEISNKNNDLSNHSSDESNFLSNTNLLLPMGIVETSNGISLTDDPFSALALLQNMKSPNEILLLIKKKLIACCITFNFTNNTYSNLKEKKRETLLELVEFINNNDHIFQEEIIPDVLLMITSNIFRPFNQCHANLNTGNSFLQSNNASGNSSIQSSNSNNNGSSLNNSGGNSLSDSKDDEQLLEPSWPHLLVIYEFFLRFVISPQFSTKVAKKYIDNTFILKLIDLFQSFDPRERDYLKTILHRIYGKIMPRRSCIRKAMKHIFLRVIIDGEPYNGIAELLEIFVSIVNGFTIPLKEEHKIFLETALIPLHKAKYISSFHQQLIYCLIQYIEKDTKLSVPIIEGVLKYWPITNSSKQILFLNELEELFEITPTNYIEPILIPIFERLASCIQSPHFHVAERVLYLWNNDIIVNLINEYKYEIYPVLIKALSCNGKKLHWNPTVHGLSFVVNKVLSDTDPELFSQIIEQYNDDSANIEIQKKEREEYWKYIIELAESMD